MKKSFLAVTLLASLGMASTAMAAVGDLLPTSAHTLQWAGTVPAETGKGEGYWVIQDGAVGLHSGSIIFSNTITDGLEFLSSSEIGFKVVKDEGGLDAYEETIDVNPMPYTYKLTSVAVGISGPTTEQGAGGYFAVHANGGAAMTVNGATEDSTGAATRISLKKADGTTVSFEGGDSVVVMAVLAITPKDIV